MLSMLTNEDMSEYLSEISASKVKLAINLALFAFNLSVTVGINFFVAISPDLSVTSTRNGLVSGALNLKLSSIFVQSKVSC